MDNVFENSFEGSFSLILTGSTDLGVTITAKQICDRPAAITVRASQNTELTCTITARQKSKLDMVARITPRNALEMQATIRVSACAYMEGQFDVTEVPVITDTYSAVKDAFTWQNLNNMNFGSQSVMLLGDDEGDHYRPYLEFPMPNIPSYGVIKHVYLKVYTVKTALQDATVTLKRLPGTFDFDEYGLAWDNQPAYDSLPTITQAAFPARAGYQIIDITEYYKSLVGETKLGFVLNIDDLNFGKYAEIATREHSMGRPPVIEVAYQDPRVFNPGMMKLESVITVRRSDVLDKNATINVNSKNIAFDMPLKLTVAGKDRSLDMGATITAARGSIKDLPVAITVPSHSDTLDMGLKIFVVSAGYTGVDATITVKSKSSSSQMDATIKVPERMGNSERLAKIGVKAVGNTEMNCVISTIPSYQFDLGVKITVPEYKSRRDMNCRIDVPARADGLVLPAKIAVIGYQYTERKATINVVNPSYSYLDATITVPEHKSSVDRDAVIFVPNHGGAELELSITVPEREDALERYGSITVRASGKADREAVITVPEYEGSFELSAKLTTVARVPFERDAAITVRAVDFVERDAKITIPYQGSTEFNLQIQARVFRVKDLNCTITVAGIPDFGYAFIL